MLTFPTVPLVLCTALIALTLLISGIAKAKDPQSTVTGIENLGLQKIAPVPCSALILPWFEIALAAVLLLSPVRLPAVIASGLALVLMIFYTVVIARARRRDALRAAIVSVLSRRPRSVATHFSAICRCW